MKHVRQIWHNVGLTALAIALLGGMGYVFAAPTAAPDGSAGVYEPVNVGPDAQTKQGNLTVSGDVTVGGQICLGGTCSSSLGGGTTTQQITITTQSINCSFTNGVATPSGSIIDLHPFAGATSILNKYFNYANSGGSSQGTSSYRDLNSNGFPDYDNLATCDQNFSLTGQPSVGTVAAVLNADLKCRLSGYPTTLYYAIPVVTSSYVDPQTGGWVINGYCPMPVTNTTYSSSTWSNTYASTAVGDLEGDVTILVNL